MFKVSNNITRPSKILWAVALVLFLFLFVSWDFSDTTVIVGYEVDFADSILHGEFSNFYQRSFERAQAEVPGRGLATYDLPVNFVLGLWGIPLCLLSNNTYKGGGLTLRVISGK